MPSKTKKTAVSGPRTRKTARKAPRKRASEAAREKAEREDRDKRAYSDPLPFAIIEQWAMPYPPPSNADMRGLEDWCEDECKVAEAALRAGFKLAVDVPPGCQVLTAARLSRLLELPLFMGYDMRRTKLLVWIDREAPDDAGE